MPSNPPTSTFPDPSEYLDEIFVSVSDDILQTLPSSPLITHDDLRSAIKLLTKTLLVSMVSPQVL